jgi:uncharacterized protein
MNQPKRSNEGPRPIYQIKTEADNYVSMRDGVQICVDIYRPDQRGRFPALLGMGPYGKTTQVRLYDLSIVAEAGDPSYIVPRGYAHVVADVRGTGKSEGEMRCFHSKQEQEDGYDLVEWIARQPWCDGNVGMVGPSYYAMSQMLVAGQQPPHLKAIFAYDSPGDWYREGPYDGGCFSDYFPGMYRRAVVNRNAVSVMVSDNSPEELSQLTREKIEDRDLNVNSRHLLVLQHPWMNPPAFDVLLNSADGPFYRERSPCTNYDKITIPVFCGSGWYAYTYTHLAGAFRNYAGVKGPKKLLISGPFFRGPEHPQALSWRQYHEIMLRWYDYWLRGINTGIMDEPPVKIFVMGVNKYRYENEWPLARSTWTRLYLRSTERLSVEPEMRVPEPDCFVQMPPTLTASVQGLKYRTQAFEEPVEVTGPMALHLYAEIDQPDTNWIAVLKDVSPDGTEVELTRGWLKASHKALDSGRSKPWQPYHTHTTPEAIRPGEIVEYDIEIRPTSNVFAAGHRIQLEICNLELPAAVVITEKGPMTSHLAISRTVTHKIYRNREYQSYLLLPIIRDTDASQWVPVEKVL